LPFGEWSAGDIVSHFDGGASDTLEFQHLAGHIEVHDIAAIVPVEPENAGASVGGPHCDRHFIRGRRSKNIADGASVEQSSTDVSGENGEMT
jgi:hypothetical protein